METPEEREVREKLEWYKQAAAGSQNADKAALAMAAMDEAMQAERTAAKRRRWAYIIALSLPPVGLGVAAYYYFSKKIDGKRVGITVLVLSIAGMLLLWATDALFRSAMPGLLSPSSLSPAALQGQIGGTNDPELDQMLKQYQGTDLQQLLKEYKDAYQ